MKTIWIQFKRFSLFKRAVSYSAVWSCICLAQPLCLYLLVPTLFKLAAVLKLLDSLVFGYIYLMKNRKQNCGVCGKMIRQLCKNSLHGPSALRTKTQHCWVCSTSSLSQCYQSAPVAWENLWMGLWLQDPAVTRHCVCFHWLGPYVTERVCAKLGSY